MGKYASWVAQQDPKKKVRLLLLLHHATRVLARRIPMLVRIVKERRGGTEDTLNQQSAIVPRDLQKFFDRKNKLRKERLLRQAGKKPRVLQCIGSLDSGGAERQLCNFVAGAIRRGWDMRVLTINKLEGGHTHYAELLHQVSVYPATAGTYFDPKFEDVIHGRNGGIEVLTRLPSFFMPWAIDILGELLVDPPDILHCWLDHTNVWAGVAALLADVPIIILSTRNVNPNHFPYLAHPLFKPWYQLLAASPGMYFINNSYPGAQDYAEWLELPLECFHVVRNGVDFSTVTRPKPDEIGTFRRELGLPENASLIAGIFRLSEEKQPLVFAEVVRRAMIQRSNLHAVIVGVGPYEADLRKAIANSGFENRFHVLGRRKDIPVIISAADVFLLTSRKEGTPNVLLEAQWLGCPVVATKAGGAVDAVSHEHTGLLVDVGDVDGLTAAVLVLLDDKERRHRFSQAGPTFIETHFGLDRMVDETLRVYELAMS